MSQSVDLATELITHFEGCKLTSYQDTAKIWTIGYGHTKGVKPNQAITQSQAILFLKEDLADSTARLSRVKISLEEHERATLLSIGYNMTLKSYNKLVDYLNESKDLFKQKLLLYSKDVDGNSLKGLLIRRISERLLFENRPWQEFAAWAQKKETSVDDIKDRMEILFA